MLSIWQLTYSSLVQQVHKLLPGLKGCAGPPQAQALHVAQVRRLCGTSR